MPRKLMFLVAFLAAPVHASDIVYDRVELAAQLATVPASAQKSGPELLDAIAMRMTTPGGDPATEFQLRRDVLALALPLDAPAKGIVQQLAQREPSIRVWHDEKGHARVAEFALNAGAAARWVLRESEQQVLALGWFEKGSDLAPDKVAETTRRLAADISEDELPALKQRLEQLFIEGAPVEHALVTVAVRAQDARLAQQLMASGEVNRVRRHVSTLHDAFPPIAQPLLTTALQRPQLAPHAVSLLGAHMNEPWAWQALDKALESPTLGAASAATMARHADEAQLAAIAQRLFEPTPVARRAALALYLNRGAYARQLLAEYRDQARESELAGEIDTWLHD